MMRRLTVTVVCLALYMVGLRVAFPWFPDDFVRTLSDLGYPVGYFVTLGIVPFAAGFVIVELFSLLTPPGRRLRRAGTAGRQRLNLWALGTSAVVALLESYWVALFCKASSRPGGASLTSEPTWLLALTILTTVFAAAGLAGLISRFGLGNGFAVLFVAPTLLEVLSSLGSLLFDDLSDEPAARLMGLIWAGLVGGLVVVFFRRRPSVLVRTADGRSLPYTLPALPQGVFPIAWAYSLLNALTPPGLTYVLFGERAPWELTPVPYHLVLAAGIVVLSGLTGWLFTARPRLEANLEGLGAVPGEGYDRSWRRQLLVAALLLAVGEGGLLLADRLVPGMPWAVVTVYTLVPLVALTLDLVDTARLTRRSRLVRVLTLDNVHLAELLRAQLRQEGIEAVVTSLRFRRLYYFLGPLFKMALLVPEADRERAERLVAETPFRIV